MKKYFAVLVIAIMAVSVLSVAEVVTAQTKILNPPKGLPKPIPACIPAGTSNLQTSPNPLPANPPIPGQSDSLNPVQVWVRVSPQMIVPKYQQVILVTILYNKKNFDPLMYGTATYTFGRTGTEASPIAQTTSDVNNDHYKDLTLIFRVKDTGLKPGDTVGILNGNIPNWVCHCDICPAMVVRPIFVTGTANVLVL